MFSFSMIFDSIPGGRFIDHTMYQYRIRIAGRTGGFGKAGVFFRVGQDPGQRIDLQDVWLAPFVQPDVDPAPVPDAGDLDGLLDDVLDPVLEVSLELGGAAEDLERFFRLVPDPFGVVGIHRVRARRKLGMVDLNDGQDFKVRRVAQDADGELAPGEELFDDDRLLVNRLDLAHPGLELRTAPHDRIVLDPLARAFVERLDDRREFDPQADPGTVLYDPEGGRGDLVIGEDLLGPRLVQADAQGQRVGAGVGDPQHLTDRRDVGFAVRTDQALGDVEDEVGPEFFEMEIGLIVGFDQENFVSLGERPADRFDGLVGVAP